MLDRLYCLEGVFKSLCSGFDCGGDGLCQEGSVWAREAITKHLVVFIQGLFNSVSIYPVYLFSTHHCFALRLRAWEFTHYNGRATLACDLDQPGHDVAVSLRLTYPVATSARSMLMAHDIIQSMSRKGNCLDNAVAASFFGNWKNELVHHTVFEDREQARSAIFDYIDVFYNRQRLHESLGFKGPVAHEALATVA